MKQRSAKVVGATFLFFVGLLLGRYAWHDKEQPMKFARVDAQENSSQYTYINPLLFCSDQEISNYTNSLPTVLEKKLEEYFTAEKKRGDIAEASLYYKDLNDGPWVLINGTMMTVPASLLKVPIALAIYKHAERDPSILKKSMTLLSTDNVNRTQHFAPSKAITPGTPYTVEELLGYMLENSDNGALYLLGGALPASEFTTAYSDLGIEVPVEMAPGYTINAKTYASFFRVLFNASYLSRKNSEQVLGLLAKATFPQGIEKGVPQGTTVAHKFGEYIVSEGDKRLNDCGIVYKPHDPYLLCVMTRGKDFDKLAATIAGASNIVYTTLSK